MSTLGTWYPPSAGTGGMLAEAQLLINPPFATQPMTSTPITVALQIRGRGRLDVQITPSWAGKGLAVHKIVTLDGNDKPHFSMNTPGIWTLTHVHTGMQAGMFHGDLQRAIAFAREWDAAFAAVTTSEAAEPLARKYREALRLAQDGPSEADIIEMGV